MNAGVASSRARGDRAERYAAARRNVLARADAGSPTAAVDVWFRAPDNGYGTPVPGLARVAATAAAAARLESGRSLAELVAQSGGRLTIEVFPDIVGIGIMTIAMMTPGRPSVGGTRGLIPLLSSCATRLRISLT